MTDTGALLFKLAAALVIFGVALAGARAAQTLRSSEAGIWLSLGNCFAGGVFIGAGLLHTLADSQDLFASLLPEQDFPLWAALAALAVVGLLWVDHCLSGDSDQGTATGVSLFIVLSLHSLLAGMALGVEAHPAQAVAILLAIVAHKGSAAFALGLRTDATAYWQRMGPFALMTPGGVLLGAVVAFLLQNRAGQYFEAVFDAIAAGTFLYVALGEILPAELRGNRRPNRMVFSVLAGLALMGVLALYT
ncbi:ZIP family metal transporter [Pseudohaliea rubra]|uniref:Zinc transporter, ZIP family n=1 Tax=Pseudohaliea rubra DSM 19751 TaxID=1265313 RepID=A0A095WYK2_9GAMM|nr:ZIP family metal transporter [Pseudohaliea rubra]KGE03699.1 Zinc transporter, ZIP family [Pseudohaliea rubra DSM 19751]